MISDRSLPSKLGLVAAVLVWGVAEAAVVLAGAYTYPGSVVSNSIYSNSFPLIGTFGVAWIAGYFLSDYRMTIKAWVVSESIALLIVSFVTLFPNFSSYGPDIFFLNFSILVLVFLVYYFLIGLGSSLLGCFLKELVKSRSQYQADSRILTVAIIVDLAGVLLSLLASDHPDWIVAPIVLLIIASLGLTFYGQTHIRILIPRSPGLLMFTSLVATQCTLVALDYWWQLSLSCGYGCLFPAAISQVISALWGTLLPPGIIMLGIAFGDASPGKSSAKRA